MKVLADIYNGLNVMKRIRVKERIDKECVEVNNPYSFDENHKNYNSRTILSCVNLSRSCQ